MKILLSGAELFREDGQIHITKRVVAFRSSANAPYNPLWQFARSLAVKTFVSRYCIGTSLCIAYAYVKFSYQSISVIVSPALTVKVYVGGGGGRAYGATHS